MTYEVFLAPAAKSRIRKQAEYIATFQAAPEIAAKCLARIYDRIHSFAQMSRRYHLAPEDAWCSYEVRCLPIGEFVLYFTIVDEAREVWVIHARHGKQRTDEDNFPTDLAALEEDDA